MSTIRAPAFAGRFYPADSATCERQVDEMLTGTTVQGAHGAIVPHAGWVYSGPTAALAWLSIAAAKPDTVVIFGAVHSVNPHPGSLYPRGAWRTPLGNVLIDEELADRFTSCPHVHSARQAHAQEHSIEVQVPLMQRLLPHARLVPLMVRPGVEAVEIGRCCAVQARMTSTDVAFVGSTDLTHYGPAFGFAQHGTGQAGVRWAMDVNDRRFVALIEALDAEGVVDDAALNRSACGAGAVAATIAAMRELGYTRYLELQHTCSADVASPGDPAESNSVGYEAGVFVPPHP